MQPYQERIISEKHELDDKISRLKIFLNGPALPTIPFEEGERLKRQLPIMEAYSSILGERIAAFSK